MYTKLLFQMLCEEINLKKKKYFHFANNDDMDVNDKFGKLQPYYNKLNKSCLEICPWLEFLDVEESMCPYYAHHGAKMYIRGKPIRFGFKN